MSVTLPARTPLWMEAPIANASSGLTPLEGSPRGFTAHDRK